MVVVEVVHEVVDEVADRAVLAAQDHDVTIVTTVFTQNGECPCH